MTVTARPGGSTAERLPFRRLPDARQSWLTHQRQHQWKDRPQLLKFIDQLTRRARTGRVAARSAPARPTSRQTRSRRSDWSTDPGWPSSPVPPRRTWRRPARRRWRLAPREDQDCEGDHQGQHGADHDEGERQRQVAPRRDPNAVDQHEASEPELARVQDHDDLLKMMRLHYQASGLSIVNSPFAGVPAFT
jgi:hypothetical protein